MSPVPQPQGEVQGDRAFVPPPLPATFIHTTPPPALHYQGAEALLYRTTFLTPGTAAALKHRPSKPYRHPTLDAKLTRHRILAEARVLVKLRREGVSVPAVFALDWEQGWMLSEWIAGGTVRGVLDKRLPGYVEQEEEGGDADTPNLTDAQIEARRREEHAEDLVLLMRRIGKCVGRMHAAGVVHGDLTTSNIMVRAADGQGDVTEAAHAAAGRADGEVVIIDFGLAAQSVQDEDRAVDLYVLERAFGSTHPRTEGLYQEVLQAYGESYKAAKVTLKRLQEVRMRGRKKIMIG